MRRLTRSRPTSSVPSAVLPPGGASGKLVVKNVGLMLSGALERPILDADTIVAMNGKITAVGKFKDLDTTNATTTIDAKGSPVAPGLIDSHVHPVFGDWTPRQSQLNWIDSFLHGGVTTMISAGEVHLPGRPRDPVGVKALAITAQRAFDSFRPGGLKVLAGAPVLEKGMVESDFKEMADAGVKLLGEIGLGSVKAAAEAKQMVGWARKYGMQSTIHTGGPSIPGSGLIDKDVVLEAGADVIGHINGGHTALPLDQIRCLCEQCKFAIEIVHNGNEKAALYALQPGEVSAPVKTEFGWHVIQLREVKSGQQESFEDVRESLAREQAEADRERAFNELSGTLMDAVLENPGSLAPAADAVDLPVQKLGPFARDASVGIAANPAVRRAAFSEALIQDGTVSDPIELAPNHNVWIRVVAHTPERVRPLAQVRDQVIVAIRADRARAAADKRADALLARLKAGESMEAVAAAESLPPPQTLSGVQRGMPLPVASVSEAVFAAQPSAEGQAAIGKSVMDDGRVVLFAVTQVTPGDVQQIDPQQRETLQQQVVQIGGTEAAQELVSTLRKRMRIEVTESNL